MNTKISYRLGAIVPPANPTCEVEYPMLLPTGAVLHVSRLPVLSGDLNARNQGYIEHYKQAIQGFGSLPLDGVIIGMTGPQYRLGAEADAALCDQLTDEFGMKVETASLAILNTLRRKNIKRISLLSPYPNWLTELAKSYWESADFMVDYVHSFGDELRAYELTNSDVLEALKEIRTNKSEAIVLSGTGMLTVDAIGAARQEFMHPMLSSNLCSIESIFYESKLEKNALLKKLI